MDPNRRSEVKRSRGRARVIVGGLVAAAAVLAGAATAQAAPWRPERGGAGLPGSPTSGTTVEAPPAPGNAARPMGVRW